MEEDCMVIHFIAGKSKIHEEIEYFERIAEYIKSSGHFLTRDWVTEMQSSSAPEINWSQLYRETMNDINRADIVIAEATTKSFGVGFQVSSAVRAKKPILLLVRDEVDRNSILWGIDEELVQTRLYNTNNLEPQLKHFLQETDSATKEKRFNFLLERGLQNYLTWAAKKTGKTRSQIIRELIISKMESDDY
jgi:hypothetical protein